MYQLDDFIQFKSSSDYRDAFRTVNQSSLPHVAVRARLKQIDNEIAAFAPLTALKCCSKVAIITTTPLACNTLATEADVTAAAAAASSAR